MFAHKIMDALKNLDFITDMYSLNDNTVCADSNYINFAVSNKFNGKMVLSVFIGNKHLFDKLYDVSDVDVMVEELKKHHMILA